MVFYTYYSCLQRNKPFFASVACSASWLVSRRALVINKFLSCNGLFFFPSPDRKTEHFKALKRNSHSSPIADHTNQTGPRIKMDHFDILATGQSDIR